MNKDREEQRGEQTGHGTEGVDDTVMTRCCPIGPSEAPHLSPERDPDDPPLVNHLLRERKLVLLTLCDNKARCRLHNEN